MDPPEISVRVVKRELVVPPKYTFELSSDTMNLLSGQKQITNTSANSTKH